MKLPRQLEALARMLAYMLGHHPDEFGLVLAEDGSIPLKQVHQALIHEPGYGFVRRHHLDQVVSLLQPPAFAVVEERLRCLKPGPAPRRHPGMPPPPLLYLAIPRALAFALSVFCLTIWFTIIAFISGYAFGILFGVGATDPVIFMNAVLKGLHPADVYNLLAKTLVPGLFTAGICIMEGLSVRYSITEVPQAATRAVVRSIATLFIISAVVSVLTYI